MAEINGVRELCEYAAQKYGEKVFCRYLDGKNTVEKTFSEFYKDCLSVCAYIRNESKQRLHIAFIGKTSYEYIACLTGMIFSGNVVVPVDFAVEVDEAVDLFERADIDLLFCEEEFLSKGEEIKAKCPRLKSVISLGDKAKFGEIFTAFADSPLSAQPDFFDKDDCALLVFTSGTTGVRKGVMLSNSNIAANTCYNEYAMSEGDVSLSVLPMHHVFCYCCDVLKTLYDGGTLCLNGEMKNLYRSFLAFEPTIMRIVPLLCKSILTRIKLTERKNPALTKREAAELVVGKNMRRMIAGSAFLSAQIIDELESYGITARQGYGMSECSPRITTSDFTDECKYSCGKILSVNEVRCEDGEIQVRGDSVMKGYYKMKKETDEMFTADGFLKTGDLGYIEKGHIYLTGRKKNLIILSNGENISPEEIENLFADQRLVREIVVSAKNDRIVAEIFPDEESAGDYASGLERELERIIDSVNELSPPSKQIVEFSVRNSPFPKTSTGKLKREYTSLENN